MDVVVTTGAISCTKLQSNHHHQQTNTQLFTGRLPFLSANEQCQSTAENGLVKQKREIVVISGRIWCIFLCVGIF